MRITLLNDEALPVARGGAPVMVDHLRQGLAAHGHEVMLITTHQDHTRGMMVETKDTAGSIVSILTNIPLRERHRRCLQNPVAMQAVKKIWTKNKPHIVHAHNLHTYLSYGCLSVARTFTENIFLTAHDTFLVSFGRVNTDAYRQATKAGHPYRMRLADHLHAVGLQYRPLRNPGIKKILRSTGTRVIAISHALEDFLNANGIKNTLVIPNGIPGHPLPDQASIDACRKSFHLDGPTVLFGGRISHDKGIDALLVAASKVIAHVPHARFLIVGEEERLCPSLLNVSPEVRAAVRTTGWLKQENMPAVFAAADVVTTPSLYLDAFNLMNIEAMAMERPVVGTCFGGTTEIIENNVTGIIVDPTDAKTYASALTTLLQDTDRRKRMGMAGKKRVEENYSLDTFVDRHLAAYSR